MRSDEALPASAPHPRTWLDIAFDGMPLGIGVFDAFGQLAGANRRFTEATGGTIATIDAVDAIAWRSVDAAGYDGTVVIENAATHQGADTAGERMRHFAEHSSSAIVITDLGAGTMDYVSPAARRIWSSRPHFATAADWAASVHPDDRPEALERRALAAAGAPQQLRYRIIDDIGETARQVRETCFAMPAREGGAGAIGGIVEDVSARIQVYLVQMAGAMDCDLLTALGRTANRVKVFSSSRDYMDVAEVLTPGCVVIDIRLAPPPREDLLRLLAVRPVDLQVILVGSPQTPPGDVIAALKAGASDFLIAADVGAELIGAIDKACRVLVHSLPGGHDVGRDAGQVASQRLAALPRREREVFLALVHGGTNKSIARSLGLSPRTVEVHRAHLMQRLNLRTLTDLVHFAHDAGVKTRP